MTTIGVTGAEGFFGWHLRCRLHAFRRADDVRTATRQAFRSEEDLDRFVAGCDAIVHLAGVNRGDDSQVEQANPWISHRLVDALQRTGAKPHVLYANSTHRVRNSPYGRSKKEAGEVLRRWGSKTGAAVADLVFPNLFGEHGRPYYNSAVATFCQQLSQSEASDVNPVGLTQLLHVQDAAQMMLEHLEKGTDGEVLVEGMRITVPELYGRLSGFIDGYGGARLPYLEDRLDLQLFNTLRSYLFPGRYPMVLRLHSDERGSFYEAARGYGATQISFSTTNPGITRGEHFHTEKIERFVVMSGKARIQVRRLFHDRVHTFNVDGDRPVAIDMPTWHAHNVCNVGDGELLTAFWTHDHFDPDHPDTFPEPVNFEGGVA